MRLIIIDVIDIFNSKSIVHYFFYVLGLIMVLVGLSVSKFLVSVGEFVVVVNWLLDYSNVIPKFRAFFKNKTALLVGSLLLLPLVSTLYSSNLQYAWSDIRMKVPLLIFPVVISTSPLIKKEHFKMIMSLFAAAVVISCLISLGVYLGIIHSKKAQYPIIEIRQISIFISHIRLSLLVDLSIFIFGWLFIQSRSFLIRALLVLASVGLVCFLILLGSLTGLFILAISIAVVGLIFLFKKGYRKQGIAVVCFMLGVLIFSGLYFNSIYKSVAAVNPQGIVEFSRLEKTTSKGNEYLHDSLDNQMENGYYVRQYLCFKELKEDWAKYSKIDINGKDLKGNDLRFTLCRYMTSKGLKKDAEGLSKLTKEEITLVERGIANINYANISGIKERLMQVAWEIDNYRRGGNPEGHSIAQRFEYWKCAWGVFKNNWLIGVGNGDLEDAYMLEYQQMKTQLKPEWQFHAHNQFLAILAGLGIIGFLVFMASLLFPLWWEGKTNMYLYIAFLVIAFCSFLNEDTLETQAGVTFFALFNSLFLFYKDHGINANNSNN